jgi:integrase
MDRTYTFSGFAEKFFRNYVMPNNGGNEKTNKASHLRVHLVPFFGDTDIRDIDREMIDRFKAEMVSTVKRCPPKAKKKKLRLAKMLSKTTINLNLGTLRKMLNVAVEWGYLDYAPKVMALKVVQPDPDWYSIEEREIFLATCLKYRPEWHCFFVVAFHTGARMGELAGLKWEDIQFATRVIRISRTRDREGNEGPPKGRRSRNVPMNSVVYEALKKQQHLDGPYVFHNSANKKLDINGGYKVFKWLCRVAGLRALRRHDIRHSFASNIVAKTGNIVAVQDILGHADLTTTRRYSHLAPTEHLDVVETIVVNNGASNESRDTLSCDETGKKVATEVATEPPKLKIVENGQ